MAECYLKIIPYLSDGKSSAVGIIFTNQLKKGLENTGELTQKERDRIKNFRTPRRKNEYYVGRIAGKYLLGEYRDIGRERISDVSILNDESGAPYFSPNVDGVSCGIAHSGKYLAGVIFPEDVSIGIDLEDLSEIRDSIKYAPFEAEIKLRPWKLEYRVFCTMVWVCREAMLKSVHGRMVDGMDKYELSKLTKIPWGYLIRYKNFSEYTAFCFFWKDVVIAISGKNMDENLEQIYSVERFRKVTI